jgi:predicted dehydrogenase
MRSLTRPVRTALIGCGMIAGEYATTLASSSMIALCGCADIQDDKARAFAQRHHLRHAAVTDLLDPAVTDIAVILTPPASHADIAHAAIRAGVPGIYAEKPLATSPGQAHALTRAASQAGVLLCAAPDTILGAPTQAAHAAINDGMFGDVIGASASYLSSGPERWHPAPEPFHTAEAGPLADMGPYYLASLIYLLGRIEGVTSAVTATRPLRTIATGPRAGQGFTASAPTHVVAVLRTETGIPVTFAASFDTAGTRAPHLEIHGSRATMALPDPNFHAGDVLIRHAGNRRWEQLPPAQPAVTPSGRGMGVLELAEKLSGSRRHLACTGRSAAHVTSIIDAIYRAATSESITPASPLDEDLPGGLPRQGPGATETC